MVGMISIVINCDTRPGCGATEFTVGDDGGQGSLHGVRSWDFLTALPKTMDKFFSGYDHEIILYIDLHEQIPQEVEGLMELFALSATGRVRVIAEVNDRSRPRWNDHLYLNALKYAEGNYIVHMDQDCAIFRDRDCDIVDRYLKWLEEGYKFVCQPTDLTKEEHGMWWASTRFFICKRETLDWDALYNAVSEPYSLFNKYPWSGPTHLPCFEHYLGVMAGDDGVLYPPREDGPEGYTVANWARYHQGVLQSLNKLPYAQVAEQIQKLWGLCGASDCLATSLS